MVVVGSVRCASSAQVAASAERATSTRATAAMMATLSFIGSTSVRRLSERVLGHDDLRGRIIPVETVGADPQVGLSSLRISPLPGRPASPQYRAYEPSSDPSGDAIP